MSLVMAAMMLHVSTLLVLAGNLKSGVLAADIEACQYDMFRATCRPDEVIIMTSAEFGRMQVGRCITEDFLIGCTNDVLPVLDRRCSGQQKCEFPVRDLESQNKNCSRSMKMYLFATFTCLSVKNKCDANGRNFISGNYGHLSNHINCGASKVHWNLQLQTGQTVHLSLIDFAATEQVATYITCKYIYGYILERALGINHTICGGKHREMPLYSSKTNNIDIFLISSAEIKQTFLIKYEVTGCPDLKRPDNAWYKREGNEAVIGCETNDQEWRLTCTGNTWQGSVGNCSQQTKEAVIAATRDDDKTTQMSSVVVIAAFAGGALVFVVIIIVIGVVYLQKYRMKQETVQLQKTYATLGRNGQPTKPGPANPSLLVPNGQPHSGTVNSTNLWLESQPCVDNMTSDPTQWTCTTLPARPAENENLMGTSDQEGLYNSLK